MNSIRRALRYPFVVALLASTCLGSDAQNPERDPADLFATTETPLPLDVVELTHPCADSTDAALVADANPDSDVPEAQQSPEAARLARSCARSAVGHVDAHAQRLLARLQQHNAGPDSDTEPSTDNVIGDSPQRHNMEVAVQIYMNHIAQMAVRGSARQEAEVRESPADESPLHVTEGTPFEREISEGTAILASLAAVKHDDPTWRRRAIERRAQDSGRIETICLAMVRHMTGNTGQLPQAGSDEANACRIWSMTGLPFTYSPEAERNIMGEIEAIGRHSDELVYGAFSPDGRITAARTIGLAGIREEQLEDLLKAEYVALEADKPGLADKNEARQAIATLVEVASGRCRSVYKRLDGGTGIHAALHGHQIVRIFVSLESSDGDTLGRLRDASMAVMAQFG